MSNSRGGKPYLVVNRALNKAPTLWIFPPGMLYALGIGFFLSFVFLVLLFQAPWWLVFLFWCWVSIVYYAVVGEKPWKFANRVRPAPHWMRGNKQITQLLSTKNQTIQKLDAKKSDKRLPQAERQIF
jgi:membrane protein implicated in regulation of membrane protease activity